MMAIINLISDCKFLRVAILSLNLYGVPAIALEPLDETELSSISGQEGVQISLDYYYNAVKNEAQTFADAGVGGQPSGYGISACGGGNGYASALGDMDCRLSWQLANRGAAAVGGIGATGTWTHNDGVSNHTMQGEWLVWKAGWMSLSASGLNLDASTLGDAGSAGVAYESWLGVLDSDPQNSTGNMVPVYGSFVDGNGNCLLPDGHGIPVCTLNYLKAMPALKTHYSASNSDYDGSTRTLQGYNDVRFGMQVIGLSAEYDDPVSGTPGWQRNEMGSFTSLRIADNNGNQAGMTFGGNFYLYGF